MRIALFPNWGLSNIVGDSDFYEHVRLARLAAELYDDMYFYCVIDKAYEDQRADFPQYPNLEYIFVDEPGDYMSRYASVRFNYWDLFSQNSGLYPIDAVFTSRLWAAPHIGQVLVDTRVRKEIPVIARSASTWSYGSWKIPYYNLVTAVSAAFCYYVTFGEYDYEDHYEYVRNYLSPAMLKHFEETNLNTHLGLEFDKLDLLRTRFEKNPKLTLFYGTRFSEVKQVENVFKVYDQVYATGRDIDIVITTPNTENSVMNKGFVQKYLRNCTKLFGMGYEKEPYLREAARSHVFMTDSRDEMASNFLIEQMYLGVIGVVPDRAWVWSMIPRDYPFVFRGNQEAYNLITWILDNYEEAYQKFEPYIGYIREHYDYRVNDKKILDHIRNVVETTKGEVGSNVVGFMKKLLKKALISEFEDVDEFSLDTFVQIAKNHVFLIDKMTKRKSGFHEQRMITKWQIYRFLQENGYRDLCNAPQPIFRRKEN